MLKGILSGRTGVNPEWVEELQWEKAIWTWSVKKIVLQTELLRSNSRLGSLITLSGMAHTVDESSWDQLGNV